eukprot:SAG11_NODE_467_length_9212_cov_2.153627_5_plen_476_part_00
MESPEKEIKAWQPAARAGGVRGSPQGGGGGRRRGQSGGMVQSYGRQVTKRIKCVLKSIEVSADGEHVMAITDSNECYYRQGYQTGKKAEWESADESGVKSISISEAGMHSWGVGIKKKKSQYGNYGGGYGGYGGGGAGGAYRGGSGGGVGIGGGGIQSWAGGGVGGGGVLGAYGGGVGGGVMYGGYGHYQQINKIYYRDGNVQDYDGEQLSLLECQWKAIKPPESFDGWLSTDVNMVQIAVSSDGGHVVAVSDDGECYYRPGFAEGAKDYWQKLDGPRMKQVAITEGAVQLWAVGFTKNTVWRRESVKGSWERIEGALQQVSISADGTRVIGVSADGISIHAPKIPEKSNSIAELRVFAPGLKVWLLGREIGPTAYDHLTKTCRKTARLDLTLATSPIDLLRAQYTDELFTSAHLRQLWIDAGDERRGHEFSVARDAIWAAAGVEPGTEGLTGARLQSFLSLHRCFLSPKRCLSD